MPIHPTILETKTAFLETRALFPRGTAPWGRFQQKDPRFRIRFQKHLFRFHVSLGSFGNGCRKPVRRFLLHKFGFHFLHSLEWKRTALTAGRPVKCDGFSECDSLHLHCTSLVAPHFLRLTAETRSLLVVWGTRQLQPIARARTAQKTDMSILATERPALCDENQKNNETMNILNVKPEDTDRSEPFCTILDLLEEHTEGEILSAISDNALFDSEDEELDQASRLKAARLHLELEQLLERMEQFEETVNSSAAEPEVDIDGSN